MLISGAVGEFPNVPGTDKYRYMAIEFPVPDEAGAKPEATAYKSRQQGLNGMEWGTNPHARGSHLVPPHPVPATTLWNLSPHFRKVGGRHAAQRPRSIFFFSSFD